MSVGYFLIFTFLFSVGSMAGWLIEVVYRRFFSAHHWVNPGFLAGPCLPLYGISLCMLYVLAKCEKFVPINIVWLRKLLLFIVMSLVITVIEYLVGVISLKVTKVRLWDYSNQPGNIGGFVCPLFTFFWMILSAVYYFFVHPYILDALSWLSGNLAFSFVIGFFYGIFVIDLAYSTGVIIKIRQFAKESEITVKLDELKEDIYQNFKRGKLSRFILSLHTGAPFRESLQLYRDLHFDADKIKEKLHVIRTKKNDTDSFT